MARPRPRTRHCGEINGRLGALRLTRETQRCKRAPGFGPAGVSPPIVSRSGSSTGCRARGPRESARPRPLHPRRSERHRLHRLSLGWHLVLGKAKAAVEDATAHSRIATGAAHSLADAIEIIGAGPSIHAIHSRTGATPLQRSQCPAPGAGKGFTPRWTPAGSEDPRLAAVAMASRTSRDRSRAACPLRVATSGPPASRAWTWRSPPLPDEVCGPPRRQKPPPSIILCTSTFSSGAWN